MNLRRLASPGSAFSKVSQEGQSLTSLMMWTRTSPVLSSLQIHVRLARTNPGRRPQGRLEKAVHRSLHSLGVMSPWITCHVNLGNDPTSQQDAYQPNDDVHASRFSPRIAAPSIGGNTTMINVTNDALSRSVDRRDRRSLRNAGAAVPATASASRSRLCLELANGQASDTLVSQSRRLAT